MYRPRIKRPLTRACGLLRPSGIEVSADKWTESSVISMASKMVRLSAMSGAALCFTPASPRSNGRSIVLARLLSGQLHLICYWCFQVRQSHACWRHVPHDAPLHGAGSVVVPQGKLSRCMVVNHLNMILERRHKVVLPRE